MPHIYYLNNIFLNNPVRLQMIFLWHITWSCKDLRSYSVGLFSTLGPYFVLHSP